MSCEKEVAELKNIGSFQSIIIPEITSNFDYYTHGVEYDEDEDAYYLCDNYCIWDSLAAAKKAARSYGGGEIFGLDMKKAPPGTKITAAKLAGQYVIRFEYDDWMEVIPLEE